MTSSRVHPELTDSSHTLYFQVVLRDTPPPFNKENECSSSPTWFLPRRFLTVPAFPESIKGIGEGGGYFFIPRHYVPKMHSTETEFEILIFQKK